MKLVKIFFFLLLSYISKLDQVQSSVCLHWIGHSHHGHVNILVSAETESVRSRITFQPDQVLSAASNLQPSWRCDLHSQNCCWSIVVDRILSGCDRVHVQMTGFLASFASHSTDKGQGILSSPQLPL